MVKKNSAEKKPSKAIACNCCKQSERLYWNERVLLIAWTVYLLASIELHVTYVLKWNSGHLDISRYPVHGGYMTDCVYPHREDGKYPPDIGFTNNYFGNWAGAYRETQKGVGETEGGGEYWEKLTLFVIYLTKCPKRGGRRTIIPPLPLADIGAWVGTRERIRDERNRDWE